MFFRRPQAIGLIILGLAVASPSAGQDAGAEDPSWLLVIQGEVVAIAEGEMAVVTSPRMLGFTDRPDRQVRFFDLPAFVAGAWAEDGDFRLDPPNAAVVDETGGTIAIVVIVDAEWLDGVLHMKVDNLEGTRPAVGDYIAITIDACDPASPYCNPY